jgi:hypothetical protein
MRVKIGFVLGLLLLCGAAEAALYPAQCATCLGPKVALLEGVTTGTGTTQQLNHGTAVLTMEMYATGTITGGTIVIEYISSANQSGTWTTLYTWTVANAPTTLKLRTRYGAVRARVTSTVTGSATPLAYVYLFGSGY